MEAAKEPLCALRVFGLEHKACTAAAKKGLGFTV